MYEKKKKKHLLAYKSGIHIVEIDLIYDKFETEKKAYFIRQNRKQNSTDKIPDGVEKKKAA